MHLPERRTAHADMDQRRAQEQPPGTRLHQLCGSVPYLGRVCIHPHIHSHGEWFLTCQALRIDKHPLGSVSPKEAERLAEAELVRHLEGHIAWCRSALAELLGESDMSAT